MLREIKTENEKWSSCQRVVHKWTNFDFVLCDDTIANKIQKWVAGSLIFPQNAGVCSLMYNSFYHVTNF